MPEPQGGPDPAQPAPEAESKLQGLVLVQGPERERWHRAPGAGSKPGLCLPRGPDPVFLRQPQAAPEAESWLPA